MPSADHRPPRFGNASAAATDRRTAGAARRFAPAVAAADSRGGPRRRPRSASRARAPWPRRAQLVLHGVVAAAALQRRPLTACLVSLPVRLGSDCSGSGRRGSLLARGAAGRPADRVERERAEELLLLLPRPSLRCPSPRRASSLAWLILGYAGVERLDPVWPTRDAVSCLVFPAGDLSEEGRGRASARSS